MNSKRLSDIPAVLKKFTAVTFFYLLLFASLAAAAYLVVSSSSSSIESYNHIAERSTSELILVMDIRQEADAIQLSVLRLIFNTEEEDVLGERENILEIEKSNSKHWQQYVQLKKTPMQNAVFDRLLFWRKSDSVARSLLLQESEAKNNSNMRAVSLYYTLQKPAYEAYQTAIQQLSDQVNANIATELDKTDRFVNASSGKVNGLLLLSFLLMIVCGVAVALHQRRFFGVQAELLREREEKQAEISRQTIDAQEKERNEIGRELHDNINQILAVVNLKLSAALQQPEKANALLPDCIKHVKEVVQEIRGLSKSLVSPVSNNISLQESIRELVKSVQALAPQTNFLLFIEEMDEIDVRPDVKLAVYRIVQEQLNNILKHAFANIVQVHLMLSEDSMILEMSDDGIGFDINKSRKGIGMSNIINRAEAHQGQARFRSEPMAGCSLHVNIPTKLKKHRKTTPFYRKLVAAG